MENSNKKQQRPKRKGKFARREKSEFDQKLLDLARVTRVVKGGRRFSFRASIVIGNRKGKVGFGVAKGSDVSNAIGKAVADAKKNLVVIKRTNTSIAFNIEKKFGAAKVLLKPAKEGRGVVAGGAMRAVIELAGIKDVTAKSLGSSNKINVARATIAALADLSQPMIGEPKTKKNDGNGQKEKNEKLAVQKSENEKSEKKEEVQAK